MESIPKTYYEDEYLLITSKRIVTRRNGETFDIRKVRNPRITEGEWTSDLSFIDRFLFYSKEQVIRDEYRMRSVKVTYGIKVIQLCSEILHRSYSNLNSENPGWEWYIKEHSEGDRNNKSHFLKIVEAIGAAKLND